jgi:hypothetical protein
LPFFIPMRLKTSPLNSFSKSSERMILILPMTIIQLLGVYIPMHKA